MSDLKSLSENELQDIIVNAEKALKNIQVNKRKEVIAEIKRLAESIDMTADLNEIDKKPLRKGNIVAIKYRDPNNAENTWKGRGVMPRWLRDYLNAGRDRSEFEV